MPKWVQASVAGATGPVLVNLDVLEQLRVVQSRGAWAVSGFPVGGDPAGFRLSPLYGDRRSAELHLEQLTGVVL